DKWRWVLGEDGEFTVKELVRLVNDKILHVKSGSEESLWNKLAPKKVNIFVWRALKGRLPVRVKLDRRGIDLDSVLCPCCNNIVETCAHSLVTCDLAMSVWEKISIGGRQGALLLFLLMNSFHPMEVLMFPPFYLVFGNSLFGLLGTSFGKKEMPMCLIKKFQVRIRLFKFSSSVCSLGVKTIRALGVVVPNSKSSATSAKESLAPEMLWHQNSVALVWHQNSGAIAFF
ncbi:RNA-directed DNA polymerase, eukaryota, reverse transcriptase zinc-binding domain protein, partial [Tanacetum coccineum]